MNLTQITSAELKRIASLLEQKESLQAEINQIQAKLEAFGSGKPTPTPTPVTPPAVGAAKKRVMSPEARARIAEAQRNRWAKVKGTDTPSSPAKPAEAAPAPAAPAARKRAPRAAAKAGVKTAGKAAPKAAPKKAAKKAAAKVAKPAAKRAAKRTREPATEADRPQRGRFGSLRDSVIALLQAAGREGATTQAMAAALKLNPQRVHAWFSRTGKKLAQVKKMGPGKYRWAD